MRPLRRAESSRECQLLLIEERDLARVESIKRMEAIRDLWAHYRPTVVIFSRYAGDDYRALLSTAQNNGTPIVAHLDDDLFNVPEVLGAQKRAFHGSAGRLASMRAVFLAANLIYIPTAPLADRIREYGFNAQIVVPPIQVGADANEMSPPRTGTDRTLTIGYMGSSSHQHDLELVVPALERLLEDTEIRFETFGTVKMPSRLEAFAGRVSAYPAVTGYAGFLDRLQDLGWDLGLAPLRRLQFNDFRTYTKWLEYTMAGTCVIASECVVYRDMIQNGAGVLAAEDHWFEVISDMVDSPRARHRCVVHAQRRVGEKLNLEQLGKQILKFARIAGVQ